MKTRLAGSFLAGLGVLAGLVSTGCREEPVASFEPNWVYSKSIEMDSGYPMDKALAETQTVLDRFFGTPDEPRLPDFLIEDEEYQDLVSLERIQHAAGPPLENGHGLYREHCSTCHGIVGNGRGTTAALLDPLYPRDYRAGKFKFKDTTRSAKPTRQDLVYILKNGISPHMKPIVELAPNLTDEDVEALVDYVIYLSIRGEVERTLLMEGSEVAYEDGESLFDENSEEFEDQLETVQEIVFEIADSWIEAEERTKEVPDVDGVPVPATIDELHVALAADGDSPIKQSIARGKELFVSEIAACAKCHGPEGKGDGPQQDYDDWTKEWTLRIGIDPTDSDSLVPLIARGALPPRKISPRNFAEGIFRGGSEPEHIYLRIANGIDGTPMPAATLPPEDIWHLVNFVRSLAQPQQAEAPLAVPGEEQAAQSTVATR